MEIVFLIYGAAFLLLGTVILAQPRYGSGFALSRNLWLLAGFALLHGVNEWLDLWKLIRGSDSTTNAFGLLLLLSSYGFLFEFGRRVVLLARPAMSASLRRLMHWPSYVLLLSTIVVGGLLSADPTQDLGTLGRYLLGFPGALLCGLGLIFYYRLESARLFCLGVQPYFYTAGVTFIVYGVLSGLVVPAADFFPANALNYDTFIELTGMPVQLYRAICAVIAAITVGKLLGIFNWEARQTLEQALQDAKSSALRFRNLVESTSDWVWEVDANAVYTYASPKVHDILGYRPEEIIGKTPFDLMVPAEAARIREIYSVCVTAQRPCYNIENTNLHINGHSVVLETSAMPIFKVSGEFAGFRGIDRDITARKQAELELRQNEKNLAEAQRIAHVGSWDWDIMRNTLCWSAEACKIFGVPAEQSCVSFALFLETVWFEDRERVQQSFDAALHQGEPFDLQYRVQHATGEIRTVHARGEAQVDANSGRALCMVGTVQDISEQKRAEMRLRQAATVFESTSEGVMITRADQRIVAVNDAFSRITGYAEHEVIGKTPNVLQSGRHGREFYQTVWHSLQTTGRWQGEIWNRHKSGGQYPEWLNISAVRDDADNVVNYIGVFADISSLKEAQYKLQYAAHHDALTGLPNRLLFHDRLQQVLARAQRHGEGVALLFIDLDHFKMVNDTLGHDAGDVMLQEVARRLSSEMRKEDTVARMGGDEFVMIQQSITKAEEAGLLAARLLNQVCQPMTLAGHEIMVGMSIGICIYPQDGEDATELLKNADTAMYSAKEQGRNGYQYYANEMSAAGVLRLELESDLRHALERGELLLHYQPQVDLRDGRIVGAEALARWRHPERGMVSPAVFIPLAEDIGLIGAIGEWALTTACTDAKAWQQSGLPPLRMAVNASGQQISNENFVATVLATLKSTGLAPGYLEIEVTESVVMKDAARAISTLNMLKGLGVALAIDDFGTGYSSLSYLKRFPIDKLKIDKSFVDGVPDEQDDAAIVSTIISMAHSLKLTAIAEGVETDTQREFLRAQGCDEMQGYLYSKPVPAPQFVELLRNSQQKTTLVAQPVTAAEQNQLTQPRR